MFLCTSSDITLEKDFDYLIIEIVEFERKKFIVVIKWNNFVSVKVETFGYLYVLYIKNNNIYRHKF